MDQQEAATQESGGMGASSQQQQQQQVQYQMQAPYQYAASQVRLPQAVSSYSHLQQQQLQHFWTTQMQEIEQVTDFKNHQLPLARIKKIMKADEDVRMISAEAPVLFAKACEMFILELTLRSWIHTEENKRRTLQRNDIAAAITRTDIFDFLVDIVPRDELKEEGLGAARTGFPIGSPADAIPYYYVPQPQAPPGLAPPVAMPPGTFLGRPAMPVDPAMYGNQPRMSYFPPQQQLWQQQAEVPDSTAASQPPPTSE